MSKYISEQHITGELGVNQFHNYCLRHKPFIIFRQENVSDFGIDGEVELSAHNIEKKLYATGEIIKVQIKSTAKGSYIHKETEESFEFHATQDDIDYWNRHSLTVILVLYDGRNESLYAKKIDQFDAATKKTRIPIVFDKRKNLLKDGNGDFRERFSTVFKRRVDYSRTEKIAVNIFPLTKQPRYLFEFNSLFTDARKIFDIVSGNEVPNFKLVGNKLYTLQDIKFFKKFCDNIIDYNSKTLHPFRKVITEDEYYRICIELINRQFQEAMRVKKIGFNRKYRRYYFMPLHQDFDEKLGRFRERIETYTSKKKRSATRHVVIYRTYGKNVFFRHLAFETKPTVINDQLHIILTPQYFFTKDGKEPLDDPEVITKLTNYLTAREFNEQILNHIHFIYSFLAGRDGKISLCEIENSELQLSKYISVTSEFSIPLDYMPFNKSIEGKALTQQNLFHDDED